MSDSIKLRYLPTSDELSDSTLSEAERARVRAWRKRPLEPFYYETARILRRMGLDLMTCHITYYTFACGEARRRLGPESLIS